MSPTIDHCRQELLCKNVRTHAREAESRVNALVSDHIKAGDLDLTRAERTDLETAANMMRCMLLDIERLVRPMPVLQAAE